MISRLTVLLVVGLAYAGAVGAAPAAGRSFENCRIPDTPYGRIAYLSDSELQAQQGSDFSAAADMLRRGDLVRARLMLHQVRQATEHLILRRMLPTPEGTQDLPDGMVLFVNPGLMARDADQFDVEIMRYFQTPAGVIELWAMHGDGATGPLRLTYSLEPRTDGRAVTRTTVSGHDAILLTQGDQTGWCVFLIIKLDDHRQVRVGPHCGQGPTKDTRTVMALAERLDFEALFGRIAAALPPAGFLNDLISPDQRWAWVASGQAPPLMKRSDPAALRDIEQAIPALFVRAQLYAAQDHPWASFMALRLLDDLIQQHIDRALFDCLPVTLDWTPAMKAHPDEIHPVQTELPDPRDCAEEEPWPTAYEARRDYSNRDRYISVELKQVSPFADLSAAAPGGDDDRLDVRILGPRDEATRKAVLDQIDQACVARVFPGAVLK